jgi:GNAT superfamily N-acetyltransferase
MSSALRIRPMRRPEVDELVLWAALEGWNPGAHDAELFWENDPQAFIAAELGDELIGAGAITSYGGDFGFMGFFIVRPEHRGKGLGNTLWHARRQRLLARLKPGATAGLDGVFALQNYYAAGGFVFSHRNLRFRADVPALELTPPGDGAARGQEIVPLPQVPLPALLEYDRSCFAAERTAFVQAWIAQPDALALACLRAGQLAGYGVVRRCRDGFKIGPLFADDIVAARALYGQLSAPACSGPLFLDAPENNPAAMQFVREQQMQEVFGCARMYLGPPPDVRHERIFGVTTFELG